MAEGLNPQQRRFVREYLVDMNQTKAARRAGYSHDTARQTGYDLMQLPKIQDAIKAEQAKIRESFGITPERVIQELAKIAFANIQDYICLDEDGNAVIDLAAIDADKSSALDVSFEITKGKSKTVSTKIRLLDKGQALEKIGKHLGMFADKVDHKVTLTLEQLVEASMEPKVIGSESRHGAPPLEQSQPLQITDATYEVMADTSPADSQKGP